MWFPGVAIVAAVQVAGDAFGAIPPVHGQAAGGKVESATSRGAKLTSVPRHLGAAEYTGPAYSTRNLSALLDRFAANMDVRVPPPLDLGDKDVVVRFDISLHKVVKYSEHEGIIQLSAWYRLAWNDDRLLYDGDEVFGPGWQSDKHWVLLSPEAIWKPDIVPYYSTDIEDVVTFRPTQIHIYDAEFLRRKGYNVFWGQPSLLNIACAGNLVDFPFDTQRCTLIVGPWSATAAQYRFRTLIDGDRPLTKFRGKLDSEEWHVELADFQNVTQDYLSGIYEEVHYTVLLTRNSHYYLVNAVLPMFLVVIGSSLACWLPIAGGSGERLGFSATLLLTVLATTLFTAEKRPASGSDTWLDQFQAWCIFLCFLPVVQTGLLVWIQHLFERVSSMERLGDELGGGEKCSGAIRSGGSRSECSKGSELAGNEPMRNSFRKRLSNASQLLVEEPVSAADIAAISSFHGSAGWVSQLVVKVMHSWKATPRTIDRVCRHLYTTSVALVGRHMLQKIPAGRAVSSSSFDIASERVLLLTIVFVLGFMLLLGAIALCLALFRVGTSCATQCGSGSPGEECRPGSLQGGAGATHCDKDGLLHVHGQGSTDLGVVVEAAIPDALREAADSRVAHSESNSRNPDANMQHLVASSDNPDRSFGRSCNQVDRGVQLKSEPDDLPVGDIGAAFAEDPVRHRNPSRLDTDAGRLKKQLCCWICAPMS